MNNHPIRDRSQDDGSPNSKHDLEFVDRHLLESRQLIIAGDINQKMAEQKCARLLAMAQISDAPITLFLSSPGGHVESGDMIHDTIRFILPKIQIIGTGWVASAGALIFVSVPLERRFCLPNTRFLLHQPSGGAGGQATDIEIQASEILRMQDRLNRIFAQATGQSLSRIEKDTDRDYWMLPDEAIEYGLVGRIISSVGELPKT